VAAVKNKKIVHQYMGSVKTTKQKASYISRDMTPLTIFMLYFASVRDNNKHCIKIRMNIMNHLLHFLP